jgi:hypothetical protein
LNADIGGATAPTENAGIEVNRGSSANVVVRWNETSDVWDLTEDGTNFYQVVNRNQTANATYAGILTVLDSVTNTSITIAASANSVKRAYDIAATAYSNAIAFSASAAANADNITSGTLVTARLPATANISTLINVGANVNLSTTSIKVGNATVNTFVNSSSISTTGTLSVTANASFGANVTISSGSLVLSDGSLTVNGNITTTGYVDASSDARIKKNIRPITDALQTVLNIEGVVYDRIDVDLINQMGFIAQQIKPFVPEIVNGTEEGGYRVSYQNITALLVEAIKDLNNKIEVIALQEQAIEYLNSKLEELQKRG